MAYFKNYKQADYASLSQSTITALTTDTAQAIGGRIDCSKYSKIRLFFKLTGLLNSKKFYYTLTCSYSNSGQLHNKDIPSNITSILGGNDYGHGTFGFNASIANLSSSATIYVSETFDVGGVYDLQLYGYSDNVGITVDTTYILYND